MKTWTIALGFMILCLLTACGERPEESMQMHLERAVELEEAFVNQQEPLLAAEEEENERFEDMLASGLSDMDDIDTLVSEAVTYVEEREEHLETERESLAQAYAEVEEAATYVPGLENEQIREQAQTLLGLMEQRYEAHNDLYEAYTQAIELDRELYGLFSDEELAFADLENQIDAINDKYETVEHHRDIFNEHTASFNEEKEAFYTMAGLMNASE
ncbi:YkyA family protein [Natribacillus halophilus]|uniref:Putative cell-wall binding lipoprotein n=1 Tax=Natribacillus halophilus TaxID=549003 RepID=A0A1G8MB05_9BACI|nr:YkyA family protein [Natribacillus halophilus]SDI65128.1 Putative cell-wall binding lipoprotein [Natribacillus halophilus]